MRIQTCRTSLAGAPRRAAAWWPAGASMALEPTSDRAMVSGVTLPLSNLVSINRNSIGTALRADGSLQEFQANQLRATDRGLLIEPTTTNVILQSQSFGMAPWFDVAANIAAGGPGPDATTNSNKLVENSTSSTHYVVQTVGLAAGTEYTSSFYVKADGRARVQIRCNDGADWARCSFNLNTGLTETLTAGSAQITALADNWFRISVTGTPATGVGSGIQLYLLDDAGNLSYLGDGVSAIEVWGAQLESSSFASSYIQTTATNTTRNVDNISLIPSGNLPFAGFNPNAGTFVVEYLKDEANTGFTRLFAINKGDGNDEITLYAFSGNVSVLIAAGGVSQADMVGGSYAIGTVGRTAMGYASNDIAISTDGGGVVADPSANLPTGLTVANIGSLAGGTQLNGTIRALTYFPTRLSNAELQALSV